MWAEGDVGIPCPMLALRHQKTRNEALAAMLRVRTRPEKRRRAAQAALIQYAPRIGFSLDFGFSKDASHHVMSIKAKEEKREREFPLPGVDSFKRISDRFPPAAEPLPGFSWALDDNCS